MFIGIIVYSLFNNGVIIKQNVTTSLIRNYLPDICWTLSFFFININFAYNISKNAVILNSIYIFIIALIFEILQYFHIAQGTFDFIDILIYSVSILTAFFIENKIRRKECEKSI